MPPVQSDLATRADLAQLKTELTAELKAELATKAELRAFHDELTTKTDILATGINEIHERFATKADLEVFAHSMGEDLARRIDAAFERAREWVGAAADKTQAVKAEHDALAADHQALAGKHDALRADFDRHRDDQGVHRAPRAPRAPAAPTRRRR